MSPYLGPNYLVDEHEWRKSLERQRDGMSPYRDLEESEESQGSGPADKAERAQNRKKARRRANEERSGEESKESLEARARTEAWNAFRRSRYLGPDYGEMGWRERLEHRVDGMAPFMEPRSFTNPIAVDRNREVGNPKAQGRNRRTPGRKPGPKPKREKIQQLLQASAGSKAFDGTGETGVDELALVSPEVLAGLAACFQRNGYVKWRDSVSEAGSGGGMRHGIELRLGANSSAELEEVRELLRTAGFSPSSPFRKGTGYRQPLYGRNALRFVELLRIRGQEVRPSENRPAVVK